MHALLCLYVDAATAVDEFEAKNADGSPSLALSSESNEEGRNRKRKSKMEKQGKTQVQLPASLADSTDDATEVLFLECETVYEPSASSLLKPSLKQRSTMSRKFVTSITQNPPVPRDKGLTASEETGILNHRLIVASGSIADQASSAAAAASGVASTAGDAFPMMDAVVVSNAVATADTYAKADSAAGIDSTAVTVVDAYDLQKPAEEGNFMELNPVLSSANDDLGFLPSEVKLSRCVAENFQPAVKRRKLDGVCNSFLNTGLLF